MYHDEMAIMLQDVAFITGLPVDGAAVVEEYGDKDYDWGHDISHMLGKTSCTKDYMKDGALKLA
ncbi:hypothetical protein LINGRAHAP2_LOCUS19816 [Linum grandiflorum]